MDYPNTSNFVKNTPLRVVFSTLFSVFRYADYPDETLAVFTLETDNPSATDGKCSRRIIRLQYENGHVSRV